MILPFRSIFAEISQDYGETITNPAGHTGIDYALYYGTPVLAAAEGTVRAVQNQANGYGLHIILDHPTGLTTLYAHLSEVTVKAGEKVQSGEVIGLSGSSGNSTGPHLHFEVRVGEKTIDPKAVLYIDPDPEPEIGEPWEVTIEQLLIREGPGITYPNIGFLVKGEKVCGYESKKSEWLRIGKNRWIAVCHEGTMFAKKLGKDQDEASPAHSALFPEIF